MFISSLLENYHFKRLLVILGIILGIILFKVVIDYLNYSLVSKSVYQYSAYSTECFDYVKNNHPSLKEFAYKQQDGYDMYTKFILNGEEIYLACIQDIKYVVYPSFWQSYFKREKIYSLTEAFDNNLITLFKNIY